MSEGDTIFALSGRLHRAVAGKVITRSDVRVPRYATTDLRGDTFLEVTSHGKHLLMRTTGGIITGAAIIMVAVFAGFAAGRLTSLEQMGFGMAAAVFMDATVVRSILVPSTMRLLGDRNWYLPSWLQWLPKIDVEGHDPAIVQVPDTPAELVDANE